MGIIGGCEVSSPNSLFWLNFWSVSAIFLYKILSLPDGPISIMTTSYSSYLGFFNVWFRNLSFCFGIVILFTPSIYSLNVLLIPALVVILL